MSWFAVDDRFSQHRKVLRLRRSEHYPEAVAVWALAGSWCSGDQEARETGEVPLDVLASFGIRDWELGVKALIHVNLWEETADPEVVVFHDWSFWNGPDAKSKRLEQRREADRLRQQKRRSAGVSSNGPESVQGWSRDTSRDSPQESRDSHVPQGKGYGFGFGVESPVLDLGLDPSSRPASQPDDETPDADPSPEAPTAPPAPRQASGGGRAPKDRNEGRDDVLRLCEHLAGWIERNGGKRPTYGVRWLDAARLLLDVDGRTEEQVRAAIDWCQSNEFWRSNILSMPKLREQYEQLRLRAQAEAQRKTEGQRPPRPPTRHVQAGLARDVPPPAYDPVAERMKQMGVKLT